VILREVRVVGLTLEGDLIGDKWNWAKASQRNLAWRAMLVSAINFGLKQGKFKLDVSQGTEEPETLYNLTIAGYPSIVFMHSIGWEELSFHVGVNIYKPEPEIKGYSPHNINEWRGVEAYAIGDLERRKGKWLQVLHPQIHCSRRLLPILAAVKVDPIGYKDHGRMMF
jgi:hypothetical protein